MEIEEYVGQKRLMGRSLHRSCGIWWEQVSRFYCKPANDFAIFDSLKQAPSWPSSLIGYSYFVSNEKLANAKLNFMYRSWECDESFELAHLDKKKRNQVRKGQKCCEIRVIDRLDDYWPDLQRINISNRERTGDGRSVDYYTRNYENWRRRIQSLHDLKNRKWLGAFVDGKLAAYFYGYAIEKTFVIDSAKSDSDFLRFNPNDALLFGMLSHAVNVEKCTGVFYGGFTPGDENLMKFKEKYGFASKTFFVYKRFHQPFDLVLKSAKALGLKK